MPKKRKVGWGSLCLFLCPVCVLSGVRPPQFSLSPLSFSAGIVFSLWLLELFLVFFPPRVRSVCSVRSRVLIHLWQASTCKMLML